MMKKKSSVQNKNQLIFRVNQATRKKDDPSECKY